VPLYEYQCARCGRFEVIRKFSDEPLVTCPTCGGEIQKLLSAPAIQFKGTGWYITDYARKSTGGEAAGKGSGEGGSSASGAKDAGSSSRDGASSSKDAGAKPAASTESALSKGSSGGTSGGSSGGSSGDGTTT
jgi:putative FmdB family regulatory protein